MVAMVIGVSSFVYTFGATACSGFCMVGIAKSFGVLADEMKDYFEAPQYQVAMVMGISALVYTIAAPMSLILGEELSPRKVVIFGGIVGSIGVALSSLSFSLVYVMCTFGIFFGVGNGFLYGNCLVMVGKYFKKRRSLANGVALSGGSIGQLALPPLIQYLIDEYTLTGALLILSGIYFNVVMCGALLRPLTFYQKKSQHPKENYPICNDYKEEIKNVYNDEYSLEIIPPSENVPAFTSTAGQSEHQNSLTKITDVETNCLLNGSIHEDTGDLHTKGENSGVNFSEYAGGEAVMSASVLSLPKGEDQIRGTHCPCLPSCRLPKMFDFSVLMNRKCMLYCFVMFFIFFGVFNFILFLPSIAKLRGIPDFKKAYLVSICGVSDLIGRLFFGFFADLNIVPRYKIMIGCNMVLGCNIIVFAWADTYLQMAIQSAIYGLAGGGYVMLVSLVLIDVIGLALLPKALGVVLFLQGIGGAIGQVFLGWVRDVSGDFDVVLIICGISCLLSGLALMLYPLASRWESQRQDKIVKSSLAQTEQL